MIGGVCAPGFGFPGEIDKILSHSYPIGEAGHKDEGTFCIPEQVGDLAFAGNVNRFVTTAIFHEKEPVPITVPYNKVGGFTMRWDDYLEALQHGCGFIA